MIDFISSRNELIQKIRGLTNTKDKELDYQIGLSGVVSKPP
jgi:hypothetical protein